MRRPSGARALSRMSVSASPLACRSEILICSRMNWRSDWRKRTPALSTSAEEGGGAGGTTAATPVTAAVGAEYTVSSTPSASR
ncbi:hypothetical protein FQZ97_537320 [compost metagenome]